MHESEWLTTEYKASPLYDKYKDSYISDILRDAFDRKQKLDHLYGLKTYSDVHRKNVEIMRELINLFANSMQVIDKEILWDILYDFYEDPDGYKIKKMEGVDCSADGLLSIKRIYRKFGLSETTISEYERYRMLPIFFFPQEQNGINMSRASVFGDKIDHTLFDLKKYYQGQTKECKLANAYQRSKTSKWLKNMKSFENIVNAYGIKGIFVDDNYEIYDLERNGSVITDYDEQYTWWWSDLYYCNLKNKIDEFMKQNNK